MAQEHDLDPTRCRRWVSTRKMSMINKLPDLPHEVTPATSRGEGLSHPISDSPRVSSVTEPSSPQLVITSVIRKMRGRSQAYLVRANDGDLYVVKFAGSPKGAISLVKELVLSGVLRTVGLPTPEYGVIELRADSLIEGPWPSVSQSDHGDVRYQQGSHLFVRYAGESPSTAVYDLLPDPCFSDHILLDTLISALAADLWIKLGATRQLVYSREVGCRTFTPRLIDHTGARWGSDTGTGSTDPGAPLTVNRGVYQNLIGVEQFESILGRIAATTREQLQSLLRAVPDEWIAEHREVTEAALEALLDDRHSIDSRLDAFCSEHQSVFRNWGPLCLGSREAHAPRKGPQKAGLPAERCLQYRDEFGAA